MDSAKTVVDEGQSFIDRHPELNETQKAMGGVVWGLMRALYECPNCPGVFRYAPEAHPDLMVCPQCRGVWQYVEQPESKPKRKGRKA